MTQGVPALISFVTAGFPRKQDTLSILLALQNGGSDIIELGMPFSDPIADGPVIQVANTVRRTCTPKINHDSLQPIRSPSTTTYSTQMFLKY